MAMCSVLSLLISYCGSASLAWLDATCPLVAKVHNEGRRYARQNREIVLIGQKTLLKIKL